MLVLCVCGGGAAPSTPIPQSLREKVSQKHQHVSGGGTARREPLAFKSQTCFGFFSRPARGEVSRWGKGQRKRERGGGGGGRQMKLK